MPQPIAYNTGNPISGSIEKSTLSFAVEGGPRDLRDYSSSYAGVNWYSTIPPQDGKYVIISASNPPQIWVTADETNAELLTTVNGLPDRYNQTLFTDTGSALDWLAQNAYFVSRETPDQIDADSMVLNLDAGIESSYPRTSTTWYDLSGNAVNGALNNSPGFNSAGWVELDGIDDNITTNASVNSYSGSIEIIATRENSDSNRFPINSVSSGTNRYYIRQNMGISDWDVVRGNPLSAAGLGSIDIDKFYHIVMTWDDNTVYGWKNGELMNTASYTNPGTPTTFIGIGAANSSGVNAVASNIAKVKVYNKTLSQEEINQNYYGGPIVTDDLVFAVDASNLVSYESGSTTTYSLTGSFTGSLNNGVGHLIDNGGVWEFDGTDDIIAFEPLYNLLSDLNYCTLEVWCDDYGYIGGSYNTAIGTRIGKDMSIARDNNSTRIMVMVNTVPTGNLNWNTGANFTVNGWQHLVAVFDEGVLRFYKDGILISSDSSRSGETLNASTIYLMGLGGDPGNGDRDWNGKIGIGRVYNRALTADEVAQNYNAQKQKYLS